MMTTLEHPDGTVEISRPEGAGLASVVVTLTNPEIYSPQTTVETDYPDPLLEQILTCKGPAYLVDEIQRDISADYVELRLRNAILSYTGAESLAGKRLLDFGCGCGSSAMVLNRLFPTLNILGVELDADYVEAAKLRSEHYGNQDQVHFLNSPDPSSLPTDLGEFDFVLLSGVFEHLLPEERKTVLPQLWAHLKVGGLMFFNQTPFRWFPVEQHTTSGLPLINYLPDSLAGPYARRFSKRKLQDCDWNTLLRLGIRGASEKEILGLLANESTPATSLQPCMNGLEDHVDLWYQKSTQIRVHPLKKTLYGGLKALRGLTGISATPTLCLALSKGHPR